VCKIAGFCWLKRAYSLSHCNVNSQLKDFELLVLEQTGGC